jgi:tetratricopeptide (TPR) repeat protein
MSTDPASMIAEMRQRTSLADLCEQLALDKLAPYIDEASDAGDRPDLNHALKLAATIRNGLSPAGVALLDYFEANVWSSLRRLNHQEGQDAWDWCQTELENEVVCLRRAVNGSDQLPLGRRLSILTNLGNIMSHLGRHVEAIAYYDRAMALYPKYSMTFGNRGNAFRYYSMYHYDHGHQYVFLARARDDLCEALKYPGEPGAHDGFRALLTEFDQRNLTSRLTDFDLSDHSLGRDAPEQAFRKWALQERLFLNPLNDLGPNPIAARDVLQLPTIITALAQGTTFHGFFNQIKQEYAAARWFCYEAVASEGNVDNIDAVADRELMLIDAQDCARFGIQLEKLKFAFRAAYSILDKIAVFLNAYLDLGAKPHRVTLRSVWFDGADPKTNRLHPKIPKDNLPLRGLYWLSRDFIESNTAFMSAMEPDAKEIATIRNRLEHQFLRITEMGGQVWKRDVGYDLSPSSLRDRTLRLMRSTRAATIYLVLAINAFEAHRSPKTPGPYVSEQLPPLGKDNFPLFL